MTCQIALTVDFIQTVNNGLNGVKTARSAVVIGQIDGVESLVVFEVHLLHVGDVGNSFNLGEIIGKSLGIFLADSHHTNVGHALVVKLTLQHVKSLGGITILRHLSGQVIFHLDLGDKTHASNCESNENSKTNPSALDYASREFVERARCFQHKFFHNFVFHFFTKIYVNILLLLEKGQFVWSSSQKGSAISPT